MIAAAFFPSPSLSSPFWICDIRPPPAQVGVCTGTELPSPWIVWSGAGAAAAGNMMEEVSILVAYDAHVFSQLHDEDFLSSLVAVSKPRSLVGAALHAALWLSFSSL